jgi:DNA repair exonuclease SbcCD ATPase subunit
MTTPIILADNNKIIKTIYHLADIHIRKNRHDEYKLVFNKLCKKIKEDCENSLIVIAGDILHEGLSPDNIMITKNFFVDLTKITDVCVIIGNHDQSSRSNFDATDYLTPILLKLDTTHNLFLLDNKMNNLYQYNNILFGYTTTHASHVISVPAKFKNKTKIALWHGIVHGATAFNEFPLSNSKTFNQDDFKQYDIVMLGDVHKHQYLNKAKTIAYSGSLIQQSFGESQLEHGFIKWDIETKKGTFVRMPNDYAFLTIDIIDNKIVNKIDTYPKFANIRIRHKNTTGDFLLKSHQDLTKKTTILEYHCEKQDDDIVITVGGNNQKLHTIKNDEMAIKIIDTYVDDLYKKNPDMQIKQKDVMNKINQMLKDEKHSYSDIERVIKLISLEFDNFNSYAANNYIDYTKLQNIVGLFGQNYVGKSSLAIYVLLYAIFGEIDSSISKSEFVNATKNNIRTKITLELNKKTYIIERHGNFKKKDRTNFVSNVKLIEDGNDISGKTVTDVEKKIKQLFGTAQELMQVCIMSQNDNFNFINTKDTLKREYICDILKLNIYNDISIKAATKVKSLLQKIYDRQHVIYQNKKDRSILFSEEHDQLKKTKKSLLSEIDKQSTELEKISRKKIEIELNVEKINNDDSSDSDDDYDDIKEKMLRVEDKIKTKKDTADKLSKKLNKFDNVEDKHKKFIEKRNNTISSLEKEIHVLLSERVGNVNCYFNITDINTNISKGEKENEKLKQQHKMIQKKIKQLKSEIKVIDVSHNNRAKYDKYQKNKENMDRCQQKIDDMNDSNFNQKNMMQKLEQCQSNIIKKELYISTLQTSEDIEQKYNKYLKKVDELTELNKKIDLVNMQLESLKINLSDLTDHEYNKDCSVCMTRKMTQTKISLESKTEKLTQEKRKIMKKIDKVESKIKKLEKYNLLYSEHQQKDKYMAELAILQQEKNVLDKYIALQTELSDLKKETTELEIYKDQYETSEKQKKENDQYQSTIKQYEHDVELINKNIELIEMKLKEQYDNKKKYEDMKDVIKRNDEIDDLVSKKKAEIETLKISKYDKYETYLELLRKTKDVKDKLLELDSEYKILSVKEQKKELKKLNEQYKTNLKKHTEQNTKLLEIEKNIGTVENEIKKINDAKKELVDLEYEKNVYDQIVKMINGGFVDGVLETHVLPKFENVINEILSYFVDYKVKISHSISGKTKMIKIQKLQKDGGIVNTLKLSGYEGMMLNVACRLAIDKISKQTKTNFFIIDEIFAYSDDTNISKVALLFNYLKKVYDWTIVITHNDQIKNYVDAEITVKKQNGHSKFDNRKQD